MRTHSRIDNTAVKPAAASDRVAQNKIDKYAMLASTHTFYPFAKLRQRVRGVTWP